MQSLGLGLKFYLSVGIIITTLFWIQAASADLSLKKLPIDERIAVMAINEKTNTLYAVLDSNLIALDGKTNKVMTIAKNIYAHDIAVNTSTNKIYVAHILDNDYHVSAIDRKTNKIIDSILKTDDSIHLTVDQNSNLIFAKQTHHASISPDTSIFVIDGKNDKLVKTIKIDRSYGPIAFDKKEKLLYVLNYNNTHQIAAFDSNLEKKSTFFAGNSQEKIALNQDTGTIYVLNAGIGEEVFPVGFISVVNGSTNQMVANVTVGVNPSAISLNPTLNRIYVTQFTLENISVIDGNTNTILKSIPVSGHPESIVINPITNTIYVSFSEGGIIALQDSEYKLPPLKQLQSGIPIDEIQCKEPLVLVTKYDSSPACVKPETKEKLIERKWTTIVTTST